jgi:Flp pilus assembly protein TadG
MISRLAKFLRGKRREEDGNATIEFVILFPAFLAVFMSAYESGMMMVRNVMLERSVDLAVRDLRLGQPTPPTFEEFKTAICDQALIIQDCMNVVQVQLEPVSLTTFAPLNGDARCIDEGSTIEPRDATTYSSGVNNELMLVRVCALFDPFFPGTTLGMQMPDTGYGQYALVATTAFVNEPSR